MIGVTTIPVLPCIDIDDAIAFYRALGFEMTRRQTSPNPYAATRCGDVHLHFMGIPKLDPESVYTTCLLIVPELEQLHATLAAALQGVCGKLPLTGRPRITRMRPGQTRFTLVDPCGNSLVFIRRDADEAEYDAPAAGPFDRALRTARRLRDFKNDDAAAAKVLDSALKKHPATTLERARALAARAELAAAMGDAARAGAVRAELDALVPALTADERARLAPELAAIEATVRAADRS